jgi:hypothetical protein
MNTITRGFVSSACTALLLISHQSVAGSLRDAGVDAVVGAATRSAIAGEVGEVGEVGNCTLYLTATLQGDVVRCFVRVADCEVYHHDGSIECTDQDINLTASDEDSCRQAGTALCLQSYPGHEFNIRERTL